MRPVQEESVVAEQPVFWLGGKPGDKNKGRQAPDAERYEDALREACEGCGFEVDEYVAAQGGFGGWLAHLEQAGTRYRLFWNGKAAELTLEKLPERGSWQTLITRPTPDGGLAGFVTAVRELLQDDTVRG